VRDKLSFSDHVRNGSCANATAIPTSGRVSEEEENAFSRDFVIFLTSSRSASVTCDRREIIRRFGGL
jgi:hypothetical protein